MDKSVLMQCSTIVDKNAVTRRSIDGVEHIIVSSFTLPDDVVMNGGLYPADEIAKSFKSLERTLAPIEHPHDSNGKFISATDPDAIHNFHVGAFNVNVTQKKGRVHIEKHINVVEAMKSEKGLRLLDRINELETNDNPRPIHTSTGIFLDIKKLVGTKMNEKSQEYDWVATNMNFDHDAILLDSVGAAQPTQGVGMAINIEGDQISVQSCLIDNEDPINPKTNKGDKMKETVVNALKEPEIKTENLNDEKTSDSYNQIHNETMDGTMEDYIADAISTAMRPLMKRMGALEAMMNERSDDERDELAETVGNSQVYPDLDAQSAKLLSIETLKTLSANCKSSTAIPAMQLQSNDSEKFTITMPE